MTRILLGIIGVVVAFFAFPVMSRLCDSFSPHVVTFLAIAFAGMAAWLGHTPESQAYADDVRAALKDVGMSHKEAAIVMGIGEGDLSNQLAGRRGEQLSTWRMAQLGPAFDVALAKRRLARNGEVAVIESQSICDLVNAVQAMTAAYRRPRMVGATVQMSQSEVA
jgi:hypothetical protein